MLRDCAHCHRPFEPQDLAREESKGMEAERKALGLRGVLFRYYVCPECGYSDIFVDVRPLPGESPEAFHQRYKYYPVSYAVMGYDSLFVLKKAIEKAGSIETEAVIKALEGLSYDSLRGKFTIRAFDHQADVPEYLGWTVKDPRYPFVILKDIVRVPGSQTMFTEDEVKQMRAAAKK